MNFSAPPAHARSLLFVPADRLGRLDKALASAAGMVVVDLEDAVAPQAKRAALAQRWTTLDAAARQRVAVRINAATSAWHDDDLALAQTLAGSGLGALMPAKAESAAELRALAHSSVPRPHWRPNPPA